MAKLKGGSRIYGNVTVDTSVLTSTVNASTVNSSSFILANGVDLVVLAQTGGSTSNDAYAQANSARNQANNSYSQANSAYDTANNAYVQANAAYAQANAGYGQANDAYGQANAARNQANSAYGEANLKLNLTGGTVTGNLVISETANANNINVTNKIDAKSVVLSGTGTALNAGSGDILTNKVTGTEFAFLNGSYTTTVRANSAQSADYTFRLPSSGGTDGFMLATDGSGNTVWSNSIYALTNVAYAQANTARNTANDAYAAANSKVGSSGDQTITGNVTISGNLVVQGNATTINVSNLSVNDAIILLSANATGDATDIGFVGHFDRGPTGTHAGMVRIHTLNEFQIFDNYEFEPTNNVIDIANYNYRLGNLRVNTINANSVLVLGNAAATQANLTLSHDQANAARSQANTARDTANDAYGQANTARTTANDAYGQANTARTTANAAYGQANTARDTANDAYGQANTARTTANDAYGQANTARTTANDAYGQANTARNIANAAYGQANTSYLPAVTRLDVTNNGATAYRFDQYGAAVDDPTLYVRAGETISFNLNNAGHPFAIRVSNGGANYDTGLTHVATDGTVSTGSSAQGKVSGTLYWKVPYELGGNTYVYQCTIHGGMVGNIVIEPDSTIIYAQANAARGQANTARNTANDAYGAANTAGTNALNAYAQANTARNTANDAYGEANTAETIALNAYGQANTARNQANTAYGQANDAYGQANTARNQANTAYGQANAAYAQANSAYTQANNAYTAANNIASGATSITLKAYKDFLQANTNVNAANTCDLSVSNFFRLVMTASAQFTFINAPSSGTAQQFSLLIMQNATGGFSPTFANTVYWAGGSIPPATTAANSRDLWTFITYDGGSTYWGTLTMKDVR